MPKTDSISRTAAQKLGLKKLRPGQKDAIQSLLDGHDTLVVMPTGSGKSAIYQIAASMLPGLTVVVSPLIALQQDQVQSINENSHFKAKAAVLNSTLKAAERGAVLEAIEQGKLQFLFLAPEQFNNPETLQHIQDAKPSLFVVDEAHCVSSWGHDFRPDYLKLGAIVESLGHPVTLALTATAAPPVRDEIAQQLKMREHHSFVQGFDRPNIHLAIESFERCEDKCGALLERVAQSLERGEKPGIIYTATRREAEEVAAQLVEQNINASFYHAGLKADERERVQDEFMADGVDVMVATLAFGMGIDKPDVRFVFHLDVSDSIDSYYQEIGRAGRDEKPAQAILFYCQQDLGLRRFHAASGHLKSGEVQRVVKELLRQREDGSDLAAPRELSEATELTKSRVSAVLRGLEAEELVETEADGEVRIGEVEKALSGKVAHQVIESQEARHRFDRTRLEMMQGYAETGDCLRKYLLNYFGEAFEPSGTGGCCSRCDAGGVEDEVESAGTRPFTLNSRVIHRTLGNGQLMRYEGDKMVVLFDENGYKTLGIELVMQQGLLSGVCAS